MCALYTVRFSSENLGALEAGLKAKLKLPPALKIPFDKRVLGFKKTDLAPVIVKTDEGFELREMVFSLVPSWSKDPTVKWTTYNARLMTDEKSIEQVATWKESVKKRKLALVPVSEAIESSYFGQWAGNIVRVGQKAEALLFAMAITSEWLNRETGEVIESFALLTDYPDEAFFAAGHDRSILVCQPKYWREYLEMESKTNFVETVRNLRAAFAFKIESDRTMKSGWEKRAPNEEEIAEIKSHIVRDRPLI